MTLDILAGIMLGGIVFITFMVHVAGRWRRRDDPDTGTSLIEFASIFPGEAVRSVISTSDRSTRFFRLASGMTGFLHRAGRVNEALLIQPASTRVSAVEDAPALTIDFCDADMPTRSYVFRSPEDAAEVSLWLMGSYVLAAGEAAANGDAGAGTGSPDRRDGGE
ncbi:hypothetical protein [Pseudohoeflea coraliihabitans]|uniref:DUF2550 family protein n=1 Tax=Pseudohoeflea coraliihabitans TaxID=2860393 RepID=A0ABS6WQ88_9HYPH|nr:hypothetical protein [Pseudohoeflea sp. DP4N28-3]MBW3098134.1 hypothetical protein [Pseudohoeflea sp. DP4N28-3]